MKIGQHNVVIDPKGFTLGRLVRIREGWEDAGKSGVAIGSSIIIDGQSWTPTLWEDMAGEESFGFHKTASLEVRRK